MAETTSRNRIARAALAAMLIFPLASEARNFTPLSEAVSARWAFPAAPCRIAEFQALKDDFNDYQAFDVAERGDDCRLVVQTTEANSKTTRIVVLIEAYSEKAMAAFFGEADSPDQDWAEGTPGSCIVYAKSGDVMLNNKKCTWAGWKAIARGL